MMLRLWLKVLLRKNGKLWTEAYLEIEEKHFAKFCLQKNLHGKRYYVFFQK